MVLGGPQMGGKHRFDELGSPVAPAPPQTARCGGRVDSHGPSSRLVLVRTQAVFPDLFRAGPRLGSPEMGLEAAPTTSRTR